MKSMTLFDVFLKPVSVNRKPSISLGLLVSFVSLFMSANSFAETEPCFSTPCEENNGISIRSSTSSTSSSSQEYQPAYSSQQARRDSDFPFLVSQVLSLRTQRANTQTLASFPNESGLAASAAGSRWNAWGGLAHSSVGVSFQPLRSSGYSDVLMAGLDYTLAGDVVFGVAATAEKTGIKTDFNTGGVKADGFSIAPYLAIPLNRSWLLDTSLGLGRTSVESNLGANQGSAADKRMFGALSLSHTAEFGRWQLQGKGSLLSATNRMGVTTLSGGGSQAATTTRVNQIRLGGQATYDAGSVLPFAALYYINDVDSTRQASVDGQNPANDRDAWQIQLGANLYSKGPFSGGVSYSTEFGRSQIRNEYLMGNFSYRF